MRTRVIKHLNNSKYRKLFERSFDLTDERNKMLRIEDKYDCNVMGRNNVEPLTHGKDDAIKLRRY